MRTVLHHRAQQPVRHGAGARRHDAVRGRYRCGTGLAVSRPATRAIPAKPARKIVELPAGRINHHWTKNDHPVAGRAVRCTRRWVPTPTSTTRASRSRPGRAAIWAVDLADGRAPHLRGRAAQPQRHGLHARRHAVDRGERTRRVGLRSRARLPDVGEAGRLLRMAVALLRQHGWTRRVTDPAPPEAARSIKPDYALGPHTASLGLAFSDGRDAGATRYADGAFVGQHGSWNREPPSGYKVVFVPFSGGRPVAAPSDRGRAHRLPDGGRQGARSPGGRGGRWPRRAAGGGRRRQHRCGG